MSTAALIPSTPEQLRAEIIATVEKLPDEFLLSLRNALLEKEIARVAAELGRMFDEDHAAGRLEPADIEAAIREHRAKHPYR